MADTPSVIATVTPERPDDYILINALNLGMSPELSELLLARPFKYISFERPMEAADAFSLSRPEHLVALLIRQVSFKHNDLPLVRQTHLLIS